MSHYQECGITATVGIVQAIGLCVPAIMHTCQSVSALCKARTLHSCMAAITHTDILTSNHVIPNKIKAKQENPLSPAKVIQIQRSQQKLGKVN